MKVKFWTYTQDCGDGSAYPRFFATEEQAEAYRVAYEAVMEQGWGEDCVSPQELEFDENGVLLNPDKFEE
jgi:hypothetical protein